MKTKLPFTSASLLALCLTLLGSLSSFAQISVFAKAAKPEFIAFEKANINITITNRSGQPIVFKNTRQAKWLEFVVESNNGKTVHASRDVSYNPTKVETGKTIKSSFTINKGFDLSNPGNYSAYAILRMPGQGIKEGFRSNKIHFSIINGFIAWRQKAGVPGSSGDMREYRILKVKGLDTTELYLQLKDLKRERMITTYTMGRNLSFRKFTATLDGKNNLHVLFLTTPTLHCHTIVNPNGKTIRREYHKLGVGGTKPKLITTNKGIVGVVNSTIYSAKKEQEKRRQIHNLSELPIGL